MHVIKTTAITLGSLVDGIGGTPLCARMCGAVCLWASEIEKFPIAVTKHHFPDMIHLGDITKINGAEIPPVDIIVGGSPCQDLSVAGQRKGMKHGDFGDEETTRSGLFMDQIRIVKEMRNATNGIQPRFMVWENVPGAFSSNNGEDFRAVLEETARVADPTVRIPRLADGWANSGSILADEFSISWRVIDAQYWGVPQRRRRIYLVADFGGQSAPQVLFEREGLPWNIAEGGTERQGTTRNIEKSVEKPDGCLTPWDVQSRRIIPTTGVWDALYAGQGGGRGYVFNDKDVASAGFNGWKSVTGSIQYAEGSCPTIESNMPPNVFCLQGNGIDRADTAGCNGKGWTEDVCYTLNTIDRPAVVYESHPMDSRITGPVDVCPTVTNHFHKGSADTPLVCFEPRSQDGTPRVSTDNLCPTLNTAQGGQRQPCGVSPTFCSTVGSYMQSEEELSPTCMARDYKDPHIINTQSQTVRRLTPLECERLQGYPDNYTNIPGSSDNNRYKALGNSFAIPCALFVISGCVEVME